MKTDLLSPDWRWEGFPANLSTKNCIVSIYYSPFQATFSISQSAHSWKHSHQHTLKNHTTCAKHTSLVEHGNGMSWWCHGWLRAQEAESPDTIDLLHGNYIIIYMGLAWLNDSWFILDRHQSYQPALFDGWNRGNQLRRRCIFIQEYWAFVHPDWNFASGIRWDKWFKFLGHVGLNLNKKKSPVKGVFEYPDNDFKFDQSSNNPQFLDATRTNTTEIRVPSLAPHNLYFLGKLICKKNMTKVSE